MKPMGGGVLLRDKAITPAKCLQYALTQPASVVIHGMNKMEHLDEALGVVKNFQPMTAAQIDELAARTKQTASSGKYELYKTTSYFDSTAHHPYWLG
jgi:predicted aldo/keto reductase-like oxidoreductase